MKQLLLTLLILSTTFSNAQTLKPGFDVDEYAALLRMMAYQVDVQFRGETPKEKEYTRAYRSPEVGLHNKWDMWINKAGDVMVVNLRGTTSDFDSWLENLYSAMIPACGTLYLDSNVAFNYKFASDPKAMVHVGWAIGAASLAPSIVTKIKEQYAKGVKQIIVGGHSQGGALAFLITSYLKYQIADGTLPADLVIKTYCSAAPKPGNMYYAYDFDFITRNGWAYRVVSSADWVPETPFGVQTLKDINHINPFSNVNDVLGKQKWIVRVGAKFMYRRMTKPAIKAQRRYKKFLGKLAYKQVRKYSPRLRQPIYTNSSNYTTAGVPIILQPDSDYYKRFPDSGDNIFRHHLFEPYYYLVKKTFGKSD